ncbi:uncharacterized protein MONBRDRAFT_32273 [Monosiga brevicollis MX1]|uniref:HIT domain-containing protein n=1 Tax=Monosiga brevicollis TaxID=81824 RepID=A9UYG9_MONBE|nr:uncharacterized protein MONBRDRAFT_32273 [Monosiga brevicollis MX1]EDQ89604.1 predicted protein [Monosiga brevicollis MX1]|eukprot:XP_001745633.1 hypothetical protein [Monosiga brevicollis MX1]
MDEYNPDNVFRKILDGQIPSYKVLVKQALPPPSPSSRMAGTVNATDTGNIFETEHALAILDAFPAVKGHSLLIPKGNYVSVADMPAEAAADFFSALPRLINIVKTGTQADAVNVFSNVGTAAGQLFLISPEPPAPVFPRVACSLGYKEHVFHPTTFHPQVVMHAHVHVVPRMEEDQLFKLPASGGMLAPDAAAPVLAGLHAADQS